jgi:hypothetical protein
MWQIRLWVSQLLDYIAFRSMYATARSMLVAGIQHF